jgi:hypothetical protein
MNRSDWFAEVLDRVNGDGVNFPNDLKTLVGDRVFCGQAPAGTVTYPYAVIDIVDDPPSDGFNLNMVTITWRAHYFSTRTAATLQNAYDWIQRFYGDGNRSPAYGFHRWNPGAVGSTGWTASVCEFSARGDESEADFIHLWIEFRTIMSKASS